MTLDPRLRDAAAAFSWVSLMLYEAYRRAPAPITELDYGTKDAGPNILAILVLLAVVITTSAIVLAAICKIRAEGRPWTQGLAFLMIASSVVPLSGIARELGLPVEGARWGTGAGWLTLVALVAVPIAAAWAVRRHPDRSLALATSTLVILAPFGAVIAVQAGVHAATYASMDLESQAPTTGEDGTAAIDPPPGRVVIVVFDELDRTLAIDHRPSGLQLPEFDRLANRSLQATEAYSTAPRTMITMHALLTGHQLRDATPVAVDELTLERGDGTTVSSDEATSLFDKVRQAGGTSAVAGWYHPYCRVYEIETCAWHPYGRQPTERSVRSNVLLTVTRAAAALPPVVTQNPLTDRLYSDAVERFSKAPQLKAIESHRFLTTRGLEAVADPSYELVFLHLNVPHPADNRGYYDPTTGELVAGEDLDYFDNLALVDRTLGQIRQTLQANGLWNGTALMVTGDHGYRQPNWGPPGDLGPEIKDPDGDPLVLQTVALLVKPPWPSQGMTYAEPVDNVLAHDLVLAFLTGQLGDDEALLGFVEEHAKAPLEREMSAKVAS